jgi:hypothetical protein
MKISRWLMTGVVDENIKDALESTIDALYSACPQEVAKSSIRRSLLAVLDKNQAFREKSAANMKVYGWLTFVKAEFNKSRYNISRHLASNIGTPPPVQKEFSFSITEQGAFVEKLYNLVEIEIYMFLVNNENIIPAETVESFSERQCPKVNKDFGNADTLCMLNLSSTT